MWQEAFGTGEDDSSEDEAGGDRNAADRTTGTSEAHPDQLVGFKTACIGILNGGSVRLFSP